MQIEINCSSPTYGGDSVGRVGDFLVDGLPDVGSGIEKIEVDVLLRSEPRAPRDRAVEDMPSEEIDALLNLISGGQAIGPDHPEWSRDHDERRSKGPSLTFRRAARRVSVRIVSDLSELDVYGTVDVTPELFASAAREVVAGLEVLPRRIKPDDDVDARTFLSFVRARLDDLPRTQDELDLVLEQLHAAAIRRWDAMDGWERLDVDWSVFAADARERLPDPFFFDPADDEAPHGNDTGADLLVTYLDELPGDGMAFVDAYVVDMGCESLSDVADIDTWEHDELVIAAAFAEIMVRGSTSAALANLALQALDRRQTEAPSPRNEQLRQALT
ncbi:MULTISPECIES: hypothetical protein [unclassified Nocardioides]|uniref:hypothetical protein n=1 Tax=unclassified Nocardioides TaxID=2615069 RepID=UPI003014B0F3